MFGLRSDDMVTLLFMRMSNSTHRPIISFGSTAGKMNFIRSNVHQSSYFFTRFFNQKLGISAVSMNAGRVAPATFHDAIHRLDDFRVNRSRCAVVEIYTFIRFYQFCITSTNYYSAK